MASEGHEHFDGPQGASRIPNFEEQVNLWLEYQKSRAMAMDKGCFERARAREEQTFTLVARDHSSPRTICFWIMENIETCPPHKLVDALLDAIAMRDNPVRKAAD